jgi:hypothetical protein
MRFGWFPPVFLGIPWPPGNILEPFCEWYYDPTNEITSRVDDAGCRHDQKGL